MSTIYKKKFFLRDEYIEGFSVLLVRQYYKGYPSVLNIN